MSRREQDRAELEKKISVLRVSERSARREDLGERELAEEAEILEEKTEQRIEAELEKIAKRERARAEAGRRYRRAGVEPTEEKIELEARRILETWRREAELERDHELDRGNRILEEMAEKRREKSRQELGRLLAEIEALEIKYSRWIEIEAELREAELLEGKEAEELEKKIRAEELAELREIEERIELEESSRREQEMSR